MNKKLLYYIALTVSVLLVFVGMRVSSIASSHTPKPRSPRAVIETSVKDSQEAGTKNSFSDAISQNAPILSIPPQLSLPFQQQFQNCNFTPPGVLNARAPPALFA
jgi:hypothetical protein